MEFFKKIGFFKPAWQGDNTAKALKAVEKAKSDLELAQIARDAPLREVRLAAYQRVSVGMYPDGDALAIIATGLDLDLCKEAFEKLNPASSNYRRFADVAQKAQLPVIRIMAIEKIQIDLRHQHTSSSEIHRVLKHISQNDNDDIVRKSALYKILALIKYESDIQKHQIDIKKHKIEKDAENAKEEQNSVEYAKRTGRFLEGYTCDKCKNTGSLYMVERSGMSFFFCIACKRSYQG